jgi:hypothetical protein
MISTDIIKPQGSNDRSAFSLVFSKWSIQVNQKFVSQINRSLDVFGCFSTEQPRFSVLRISMSMRSKERHENSKSVPAFHKFFIKIAFRIKGIAVESRNIPSNKTEPTKTLLKQNWDALEVVLPIRCTISTPNGSMLLSSCVKWPREYKRSFMASMKKCMVSLHAAEVAVQTVHLTVLNQSVPQLVQIAYWHGFVRQSFITYPIF